MFDALMATTLQDIDKPHQIGIDVSMRIGQGIPHACLGRKMYHTLWSVFRKQVFHAFTVCHIELDETKLRINCQMR